MGDEEEQGAIRGNTADLTVGILILSAIQGRPYEEQIEILGSTILRLSHDLRKALSGAGE